MEKMIKLWIKYDNVFLSGLVGTLWISAVTVVLGTLLGMLIAFMRMRKSKVLNLVADVYIEILRGTPILLQLYFFWIGLPKLLPFELSDTACIVTALVVNSSAYISEIIRAGISAVDKGQWEAAKSLGLSNKNMMLRVIMPQAVKNIIPAIGNEMIALLKETAIICMIGYTPGTLTFDLNAASNTIFTNMGTYLPAGVIVGGLYLAIVYLMTFVIKIIEKRLKASDKR